MQDNNKEEFEKKLKVIAQFNECDVLMKILCDKLGLTPYKTTHQEFVNAFSSLVKDAMDYRKELADQFISTSPEKEKKTRKKKSENGQTEIEIETEDWVPKNQVY